MPNARLEQLWAERGRGIAALLWGAGVLGVFLLATRPLTDPLGTLVLRLGLCAACAYALLLTGHRIWRAVSPGYGDGGDPAEAFALELGTGALAAAMAMLALGVAGLYQPWAAWSLLGLALVGPHRRFCRAAIERARALAAGKPRLPLAAAAAAAAVMTLAQSLAPVTAQDALVYHLAIPAKHVEAGRLVWIEGSFFTAFPQNVEMLFTWGLLLEGESLAQWFHWLFGAGACFAAAGLARRLCAGASRLLAAAVLGTVPTVLLIAGWAYVDLAVVLYVTLSASLLLRWIETPRWHPLIASAVMAGGAAGCKYTGGLQGLIIAAGALIAAVSRREPWRRAVLPSAAAAAVVGVVACPWWIRNVIETGNPLYPFCYGVFGGRGWDVERAQVLGQFLGQWGGSDDAWALLALPFRLTFASRFFTEDRFDGMIGAAFLLGAPLVLAATWRGSPAFRGAVAMCAVHASFWMVTTQQVRFLLPALALAAALISAALGSLAPASLCARAVGAALAAACAVNVGLASLHFAHHNPLPVVLGAESRASYLRREIPCGDYPVFEAIERELPADAYLLLGSLGNPGFLVKRRYYSDALFENRTLAAILAGAGEPAQAHAELRSRGFTHILFRLENVLDGSGKRSGVPLADQTKLMALLNAHARLIAAASGTYLYELAR